MKARSLSLVALALSLLCLLMDVACLAADAPERAATSAKTVKPIRKIGIILPLSGGLAHVSAAFRDAARMASEELPAQNRSAYELVFEDDQLQSSKAASAAQKLIEIDKVDAIISTWSYGGTVVSPIADKAGVPHFGVAWDPAVAKGKLNFLHLTPPRKFIENFFAGFKKKGYKRIGAVGWNESGSLFFLDELERLAPQEGLEIVKRIEFQASDRGDFRSAIMRGERVKPDVWVLNLSAPEIDIFVRQLAELHSTTPITSITGFEVANDLRPLEGKWYVSDSTVSDDFTRRFTERYGHSHVYGVGNFYDSVQLAAFLFERLPEPPSAAGRAQRLDPDQFLAGAAELSAFPSIFGSLKMDPEGIIEYAPVFRKIVGGKRVTVPLEDI